MKNTINDMKNDAKKLESHNINIIQNLENNISKLLSEIKQ